MKTKIFTFLLLGMMFLAFAQSNAQNVLYDGSFTSTTLIPIYPSDPPPQNIWCAFQNAGTVANPTVVDNVCNYQVSNAGIDFWEVQLTQYGFIIEPDHAYRLTFDVKADADRYFGVFLGEFWGNWTNLLGWDKYYQYATTEWQTIIINFNSTVTFPDTKISFEIGGFDISMYFDNIILEDLGVYIPGIGILGNSVSGWDEDVDMITTDGVLYTLSDYPLTSGYLKFRQDDNWEFNWGNTDFPTGFAYLYGSNIPIPNPGNYDITFNRKTGEYSFTCVDNCLPYIGIIGSAVPPNFELEPDVNMSTSDGITYTLKNYSFTDGGAKFRQDDDWANNWGGTDFPEGTAIDDGPAIPVTAGNYNVTFNIETGDYSFSYPNIGILGSALNGWDDDIDLSTSDGINYFITDLTFTDGEVKFRAENNWEVNWGGWEFPNGWGYLDGPNIYVPAGTYNVTFNLLTGEYGFMATTCPIAGIQCPWDIYMGSDPGMCGAYVYFDDAIASPNCGGDGLFIEQVEGLPSGSFFPIGSTIITFLLSNAEGNTATCSFNVFVYEFEPPVITISANQIETLWPANHQMVNVLLDYTVTDNCDTDIQTEIYVFSNQPDNGKGDGNTGPDWEIVDNHNVLLRAERSATDSSERQYYIYIFSIDDSWNYAFQQIIVKVPHDMGKAKQPAVIPNNKNKSAIIGESFENESFMAKVWPNPSITGFNLEVRSSSDELILISVYDISGRLVLKIETTEKQFIRIGESLNPGMYNLSVRQGNNFENLKIIKQK